MNKSSSKKIVLDAKYASYLIPAELARFQGDIVQLHNYLSAWSTKRGGSMVLAKLADVVHLMDQAQTELNLVFNPPVAPPKPPKKVA